MKKCISILLIIILLLPICSMAESNDPGYKITINGVNIVFVDGKSVLDPIENDGVLYVPLEALLNTLNIDYEVNGTQYSIITTPAKEQATDTPKPTSTKASDIPDGMEEVTNIKILGTWLGSKKDFFLGSTNQSKLTIKNDNGNYVATYEWRDRITTYDGATVPFSVSFTGKVYQSATKDDEFYIIPDAKWKNRPKYYSLALSGSNTLNIHNTFGQDLLINIMDKQ